MKRLRVRIREISGRLAWELLVIEMLWEISKKSGL
jgi:hypothetical protein